MLKGREREGKRRQSRQTIRRGKCEEETPLKYINESGRISIGRSPRTLEGQEWGKLRDTQIKGIFWGD